MKTTFFTKLRLDAELRRQAGENAQQGKSLKLTLDVVFKALFSGNNEESHNALRCLISDCIHRPVHNLSVRNSEIGPDDLLGKTIRLDVHASFNDGEEADIEMQAGKSDDDLKSRASFYTARILSGQARRGQKYREVKRVYQIFFLDGILFPGSSKVPRRYSMREETEHDQLSEVAEILFYELPKVQEEVQKRLAEGSNLADLPAEWKWCIYLKCREADGMTGLIADLARQEEGIMNAERALKKMNNEREQWARALWREKRAMDYLDYKARIDEARAAGKVEGKVEGIEIGEKKNQIATAQRMKQEGVSPAQIARWSGLSLKEVKKL
jgi:predicted transposase/invertase (TIGR01784 family)